MMLPAMDRSSLSCILLSCLMLLQGEDSQKELPTLRISCPSGSQAYGANCYALYKTARPWFDASIAGQKRPSGHLVSVLSVAEASFVASLVKNSGSSNQYIWIGLHDPTLGQEANGWEWSNSDVMNLL